MKILIVHNHYSQMGGEDAVAQTEYALLKHFGEDVRFYERSNIEINSYTFLQKVVFLLCMNWHQKSYDEIIKILREFHPDVVHFHNIFFMCSPSVYFACQKENVPVVQSLHNFRLRCANGLFFRNNQVCEKCLKGSLWQGVWYRCYKDSRLITAAVVRLLNRYWKNGTWLHRVTSYITATEFSRQKFIKAGITPKKIFVKPNFIYPDKGKSTKRRDYVLYCGRLSLEKGVDILLRAWKSIPHIPLKIIGEGPMSAELRQFADAHQMKQVEFLGYLTQDKYETYMQGAKFIVIPSVCYENFPRIVVEAYAYGIPVLASRLGTMQELVKEGRTGLLFDSGSAVDLKEKAGWLIAHTDQLDQMSQYARQEYEQNYTPEKNYATLMDIYNNAIKYQCGLATFSSAG